MESLLQRHGNKHGPRCPRRCHHHDDFRVLEDGSPKVEEGGAADTGGGLIIVHSSPPLHKIPFELFAQHWGQSYPRGVFSSLFIFRVYIYIAAFFVTDLDSMGPWR
jgi:hypothetical protein